MRNIVKLVIDCILSSGVTFVVKTVFEKVLPAAETLSKADRIKIAIGIFGVTGAATYTVNCWINSTIDDFAGLINELKRIHKKWKEAKALTKNEKEAAKILDAEL